MNHIDDTDEIGRARRLHKIVHALPLANADKRVLSQGLILFIESYHHGLRPIIQQESASASTGFAALGWSAQRLR